MNRIAQKLGVTDILVLAVLVSALAGVVLFSLYGCTGNKVSFDTAEDARKQVRENVALVASRYRAERGAVDYDLDLRGDSTQSVSCPQGDGWASVDLVQKGTGARIKLKCSTVSQAIGCMTADDFKGKRYAQEEDHCNPDIPFPLPKLAK